MHMLCIPQSTQFRNLFQRKLLFEAKLQQKSLLPGQSPDYFAKLPQLVFLENLLFLIWAWISHIDHTHFLVFACQCNGRAGLEGTRVENPVLPRTKGTLQV